MSLDWIVGWWSTSLVANGAANADVTLTLITSSELEDKGDSLKVERIIGQYYVVNTNGAALPTAPLLLHARIVVRPADLTNGPFLPDISTPDVAEESFMWHKVLVLPSYNVAGDVRDRDNMSPNMHPEWSHLDVKVNRSLNNNEELLMCFQPVLDLLGASDAGLFSVGAWIRVLVRS